MCPKCNSKNVDLDPWYRKVGKNIIFECHDCGIKFDIEAMKEL